MTKVIKIVKIGNSAGVLLSKEVLALLRVELGDDLFLTEGPGKIMLSPADPHFMEAMTAAEEIMREDRDILAILAK
jgi:putative addiction module antidote